jgi:signal transduction histidine kinase
VTGDQIIIESARDITEISQARKEKEQANLKSEFMAVMAHEIQTPLHQIIGYMDLLELTQLSALQLDKVKMIQHSTALLITIINDLLDYTKLEEGRLQIEKLTFSSKGILEGCIATVEPECEQKGLKLISLFSEHIPTKLKGDPNRVRQILLNVLQNAVKFTDEGSVTMTVTVVSSDESTARLRFEFVDTGIGIDLCHQTIIFEKYRQAHASVARNYGGTGLGLAICKSLTEAMGGSIGLESTLGKGTKVFLEIPFELPTTDRKQPQKYVSGLSSSEERNGLRILVVEDNKVNQKMVQAMLTRIGHTVTVADNGQLAVDVLQISPFDLVLMDIQMPILVSDRLTCYILFSLLHQKTDSVCLGWN